MTGVNGKYHIPPSLLPMEIINKVIKHVNCQTFKEDLFVSIMFCTRVK